RVQRSSSLLLCWRIAFPYLSFFFQAEDGIRDGHVTGVQTCALPICDRYRARRARGGAAAERTRGRPRSFRSHDRRGRRRIRLRRSEERRVGKESGCGWLQYDLKKKEEGEVGCRCVDQRVYHYI